MANKLMSNIHNIKKRMPLIIARELEEEWLNGESERILGFSFPSSGMIAYPVKKSNILNAINSPETQNIFEQNISSQSTLF
jgi:putative SOS response-associated peptidase YedK